MVASTIENSSDRKYGLSLNRSALASMLSRSILRSCVACLRSGAVVDLLRQVVPVVLDLVERQPRTARARTGSTGISGGCGKRSSRYSMITRES